MTSRREPQVWETSSGRRLTEADAGSLAEEFEIKDLDFSHATYPRRRGRPSLTGRSERSPQVTFRLDDDMLQRASQLAERDGVSLSALARLALDEYLSARGARSPRPTSTSNLAPTPRGAGT